MDYYNEIDPFMCQWLEELMKARQIPEGVIDERSIEDVLPNDLRGFTQCHFFAGLGGWPLAFKLAGWPQDRSAWSASAPCQPFSTNGKQRGFDDPRHLWPAAYHLISECRPEIVVGEQVSGEKAFAWLDHVQADMEACNYTFGTIGLCAAGAWAPHIRKRLFWVGHAARSRWSIPAKRLEANAGTAQAIQSGLHPPLLSPWVHISTGTIPSCSLDGLPRPVGIVRGFGNAIVPQVGAEFISLLREALGI
jgi:DNA (cytosine-5)-methyltransferase 1